MNLVKPRNLRMYVILNSRSDSSWGVDPNIYYIKSKQADSQEAK